MLVVRLGVDACNTAFEVLIFAGATNLGQTWATVVALFGSVFTFYVQTWDEYFTQTLTLGLISGPVEGILTLCIVYAVTAVLGGGSFWHNSLLATLGVPHFPWLSDAVYNCPFTHWWIIYGALVLLFGTASSIAHVVRVRRERGEPPYKPLLGLLPGVVMWVLIALYLYLQPVVREHHMVPFVLFVGLVNAYSVGQMIVAHLVKADFPYTNVLLVPLAVAVGDALGAKLGLWIGVLGDGGMGQTGAMFCGLGLALGVYGSFVVSFLALSLFLPCRETR